MTKPESIVHDKVFWFAIGCIALGVVLEMMIVLHTFRAVAP